MSGVIIDKWMQVLYIQSFIKRAMSNTITLPKKRILWIDFSRFFAILFVMETHSGIHYAKSNDIFAGAGVMLFFFLAAFFDRKSDTLHYKRCVGFLLSALVWETIMGLVRFHGQHGYYFNIQDFFIKHEQYRGVLWFMEYLVLWMVIAPLFRRILPTIIQWLIVGGLWVGFFYEAFTQNPMHAHLSLLASAAPFFLGYSLRNIKVAELQNYILGPILSVNPVYSMVLISTLILSALAAIVTECSFIAPGNNAALLPFIAYLMIAFAYFAEKYIPRIVAFGASFGPVIYLIYASHPVIFYIWNGGWIHTIGHGDFPPHYLTLLLGGAILFACLGTYKMINGKNRFIDMILFGR